MATGFTLFSPFCAVFSAHPSDPSLRNQLHSPVAPQLFHPGCRALSPWRCGWADYTKGEALPTDGLDSLAPCVSAVVMKDCVLNPDSPQVRAEPPP
eukprot:COSAG04_NODE_6307_length_1359_cov_1.523810_2_plen_96_part_00